MLQTLCVKNVGTRLEQLYNDLLSGNARPLLEKLQKNNIDMLVIHKTSMELRKKFISHRAVWTPFFFVRRELVGSRQVKPYIETSVSEQTIEAQRILCRKSSPILCMRIQKY
jgi:hypothetical protein